jgi:hypothetical protein
VSVFDCCVRVCLCVGLRVWPTCVCCVRARVHAHCQLAAQEPPLYRVRHRDLLCFQTETRVVCFVAIYILLIATILLIASKYIVALNKVKATKLLTT